MSRVAVVTGGASGLGAAICRHLADAGRQVGVLDVNVDAAEGKSINTIRAFVDRADYLPSRH